MLHRSSEAWRFRCWRASALRAQAVSKNPSKCLIAPRRLPLPQRRGFLHRPAEISSAICWWSRTLPRHYRKRLGNEPPTTFHGCRCASSPGSDAASPSPINRVIAIHRPARSKQCWARARIGLRIPCVVIGRRIRWYCRRESGAYSPDGAAGSAHTRPRGKIGLIAVWAVALRLPGDHRTAIHRPQRITVAKSRADLLPTQFQLRNRCERMSPRSLSLAEARSARIVAISV